MAGRKLGSHPNFVHNDEIWKDHVRHELQSLRRWPDEWSFLTREYCRVNKRLVGDRVSPDPDDEGIFPDSEKTANTSEDAPICERETPVSKFEPHKTTINLPPIATGNTCCVFPRTTAALIGWKSTKSAHRLEKYGRYAPNSRGQQGILKLLKWPSQGL
ncbi:ciliary microtubule inner protein 1-like [Apostichopus japonicus]|uniref:ciliary microtubule inner protein 1-like n=1 Tax=Stichopus japonicus TaxID=307972 RepID=UPI003AB808D1